MGGFIYNRGLWGNFLSFVGRIKLKFCFWLYKKHWHTSCKFQLEITSNKKVIAKNKKPLTNIYEMNSRYFCSTHKIERIVRGSLTADDCAVDGLDSDVWPGMENTKNTLEFWHIIKRIFEPHYKVSNHKGSEINILYIQNSKIKNMATASNYTRRHYDLAPDPSKWF